MRARLAGAVVAVTLLVVACSGDDDDAADDTAVTTDVATAVPDTTVAPTTPPTEPTVPATDPTVPPSTPPPTTAVDLAALKAQIAEDYVASEARINELTLTPNPADIATQAGTATAPGSPAYNGLVALIREMAANGERVIPGDPPYAETTVELVEIDEASAATAFVTACRVFNEVRVGADGIPIGETGVLRAARVRQGVELTTNGWLPATAVEVVDATTGATECSGN
jgi:hypothetical protein